MIPITILLIILLEISTITDIDSDFDAEAIRAGCLDISYITPPFFQKENDFPYQEVFFIHVIEGKQFTKPEINPISRYYMLLPEKSHAEIIEVSKKHQQLFTPRFDGWGIALKPKGRSVFLVWYYPGLQKTGPKICEIDVNVGFCWVNGDLVFMSNDRFCSYNVVTGRFVRFNRDLYDIAINGSIAHAVLHQEDELYFINYDIVSSEIEIIPIPKNLQKKKHPNDPLEDWRARRAGSDGIYVIKNFSLWFKPDQQNWRSVIKNVKIIKTFGGARPVLPVAYIGDGKFAVARTVGRMFEVKGEPIPKARSITMLIDGYTGQVLDKTQKVVYGISPPLNIPKQWHLKYGGNEKHFTKIETLKKMIDGRASELRDIKNFRFDSKDKFCHSPRKPFILLYRESNTDSEIGGDYLIFKLINAETGVARIYKLRTINKATKVEKIEWLPLFGGSLANRFEVFPVFAEESDCCCAHLQFGTGWNHMY
jgi:hypothetical protein